jgi:hypothetical protein
MAFSWEILSSPLGKNWFNIETRSIVEMVFQKATGFVGEIGPWKRMKS